ncbi:MAG: hypothetical protein K8R21_14110 [Leptospira sp.]|nr:hypothetical protein [Leptospira sp.]
MKKHFFSAGIILTLFIISSVFTDCRHKGKIRFENGDQYEGEIKGSKPSGKGTYISTDGMIYMGGFRDGKREGHGVVNYTTGLHEGEQYIGEWKENQRNGHGIYAWPDGRKYVGNWQNNKQNGLGSITNARGDRYTGNFRDDLPDGEGTHTKIDGSVIFSGQWKAGKPVK